jgi:hypothetical protein
LTASRTGVLCAVVEVTVDEPLSLPADRMIVRPLPPHPGVMLREGIVCLVRYDECSDALLQFRAVSSQYYYFDAPWRGTSATSSSRLVVPVLNMAR